MPEQLGRSPTWDPRLEMAQHTQLNLDTGLPVFMCDPHSPCQRGTNENINLLLSHVSVPARFGSVAMTLTRPMHSLRFTEHLAQERIARSIGTVGEAYDNRAWSSILGL